MRYGLTNNQRRCFDFIESYINDNKTSPSFQEVTDGINLASKSEAHRLIHGLKTRGWIDFLPHRKRTIAIIDEK